MRFSQRIGKTAASKEIQLEQIDDELRNRLWNLVKIYYLDTLENHINYFLEMDLRKALTIIKNKSKKIKELDVIINRLNKLQLHEADPTNEIIRDIKKYRSTL